MLQNSSKFKFSLAHGVKLNNWFNLQVIYETNLYSLGRESNVYSQHESVCLLFPFTVYRNLGHFPNQEQCMNYGPWMLTGLNFPYVLSLPPTSLAVPFHTFPSLL